VNRREDYSTLDELILKRITACAVPTKFVSIYGGELKSECERLQSKHKNVEPFRFCDRRLQALRKAGLIRFTRGGWIRTNAGVRG
jgi:hypothetical protein